MHSNYVPGRVNGQIFHIASVCVERAPIVESLLSDAFDLFGNENNNFYLQWAQLNCCSHLFSSKPTIQSVICFQSDLVPVVPSV